MAFATFQQDFAVKRGIVCSEEQHASQTLLDFWPNFIEVGVRGEIEYHYDMGGRSRPDRDGLQCFLLQNTRDSVGYLEVEP